MKVRAIETGYFGAKRRDPGEEFSLASAGEFAASWMQPVGWDPLDHDGDGRKGGSKPLQGDGLDAMTVKALKALADERGVDLGDAKAKADIIAAIELAAEAKPIASTDDEKIAKANEISGRTDITDLAEAEAIIAAADDDI